MIATALKRLVLHTLGFLLCAICSVTTLRAQEKSKTEDEIAARINHLINFSMDEVRSRAAVFNEQVAEINRIDPLSLAHLDSADVTANIGRVLAFTQFLASFKTSGDSLARNLEDSLFILKQQSPLIASDKIVSGFETSYNADRSAFDKYVVTLKKLYDHVLTALLFLQHTPYSIAHKRLEFTKKESVEEYQQLMKPIDATAKDLKKASEESREATLLANKTISGLNKQSKLNARKVHKKKIGEEDSPANDSH